MNLETVVSVVLPYFNEADYLPATLRCLRRQSTTPDQLILVDNGSDDGSSLLCSRFAADAPFRVDLLSESRPGKLFALKKGCHAAVGKIIVFCDADTFYPQEYLAVARSLLSAAPEDVVALLAVPLTDRSTRLALSWCGLSYRLRSRFLRKQVFTGGFGQIVTREALERTGGFDESIWPYVLLDHEIMNRILVHGRALYHPDLWCRTSTRRRCRSAVRWTLAERLVYHATPAFLKDWYFYDFLAPRLAARNQTHLRLRERDWTGADRIEGSQQR